MQRKRFILSMGRMRSTEMMSCCASANMQMRRGNDLFVVLKTIVLLICHLLHHQFNILECIKQKLDY